VKWLGQRLAARDFDRQVAELQVRVAVLNGFTALGTPITEIVGYVRPGMGEPRPSPDLCNRAYQMEKVIMTNPLQTLRKVLANSLHHKAPYTPRPMRAFCARAFFPLSGIS